MHAPLQQIVAATLLRELKSVREELDLYPDDEAVWALPDGIPNSAGTLVLHLAGNIRWYIGGLLGETGYVRDREREFAARDLSRAALTEELLAAEEAVRTSLPDLPADRLSETFPEPIRRQHLETADFLVHAAVHLSYHFGQINYHRRLVTGNPRGTEPLSAAELFTARPA